jgi:hypothetical protein
VTQRTQFGKKLEEYKGIQEKLARYVLLLYPRGKELIIVRNSGRKSTRFWTENFSNPMVHNLSFLLVSFEVMSHDP